MAMEHQARMAGRNRNFVSLLWISFVPLSVLCGYALGFAPPQDSSSSQTTHRKPPQTTRHTTVSESESPSPELTKAEALIQPKTYPHSNHPLPTTVDTDPATHPPS